VAHEDILPNHLRLTETTHRIASTRGVTISVTDWGSGPDDERPILMMSHATGLHAHCYVPLVREYEATFRCIGLDQRAQGDSTIPTVGGLAWEGVADDVEIAMGALGLFGRSDVYGIGHSQGGYAILEVERRRPGTFQSLFLYEPVIFTIKGEPGMPDRVAKDNQMASLAERRRATFPSWEDAINNYKVKGPFARADDDLLRSYVYWGFTEEADGSITLKCDPLNEAELFRRAITDLFDAASQIQCPTTVAVSIRFSLRLVRYLGRSCRTETRFTLRDDHTLACLKTSRRWQPSWRLRCCRALNPRIDATDATDSHRGLDWCCCHFGGDHAQETPARSADANHAPTAATARSQRFLHADKTMAGRFVCL
jgi:pimeloyl-ACP methyl ester carboxylesterase